MAAPRSIPDNATESVIILDVAVTPNHHGGIRLAVHRFCASCAITLLPADALTLADELRFRALAQMAERS